MLERTALLGFAEPINSLSHLISAAIFLVFGIRMLWKGRGNTLRSAGLILYVLCNVFLFSMSGVYHLLEKGTDASYVLQILDHTGIYLMISGSFTPFQIILLRGVKRWIPLLSVWTLAITGLTMTAIFFSSMPMWLLLTFYISMGWMGLLTAWFIRKIDPVTVKLLALGGAFYTIGAVLDFAHWPVLAANVFEAHELFHFMVTLGALAHFIAIYRIAGLPISNSLLVIVKKLPGYYKAKLASERAFFRGKTDEEIRQQVKEWVEQSFIGPLAPKKVRLRYYKEDEL